MYCKLKLLIITAYKMYLCYNNFPNSDKILPYVKLFIFLSTNMNHPKPYHWPLSRPALLASLNIFLSQIMFGLTTNWYSFQQNVFPILIFSYIDLYSDFNNASNMVKQ